MTYHYFFDRRGGYSDEIPTRDCSPGHSGTMYFSPAPEPRMSMSSLKGPNVQDSMLSLFPDDDSGFNSSMRSRSRSGMYLSDDYNNSPRMNRSRSMSRIQLNASQDLDPGLNTSLRQRPFEFSLRHLKDNLDDSENRRIVLVHKLKEAQETLELQNDRLNRIEGTAKTNSVLVDDLKYKEKEYRDKMDYLTRTEDEKSMLKNENSRLREEMQNRIDKLDYALRTLQAQHQVAETENIKRSNLLEQTTSALALLENENTRIKKDKDCLRQEILVAKEAMEFAREKFTPMEDENKNLKYEMEKVKEEKDRLASKAANANSKLNELKNLTETMKDENEKLASSWKTLSEEKQKLVREIENNQDNHRDARARVTNLATERDRLFGDKMDMTNRLQSVTIEKEQIEKTKIALEEQIAEQEEELSRVRKGVKRKDEERRNLEETLQESKNSYDDLYKELANVRAYYERSLEQMSVLENNKSLALQQLDLTEREKERLRSDNERLREIVEGKTRDLKYEREQLEEAVLDLKAEGRQIKQEKSKADDKIQELEIKLEKANEDVRETATVKQGEIDLLKATCDRLSASTTKKETELENMTDKVQQLELKLDRATDELRTYKDECENLGDQVEDIKKLKDENRRLHQEKAENEQVIKLLETQKDVLSKSAETSNEKLKDIEKLTDKIEQYRSDNEHLRGRIGELEKVRDNLIAQKEELLANSELIYKKPQMEELESKIDELRDANKQLREINEQVNEKAESLQQENVTLKDAVGGDGSIVPRIELERLAREKERLQSDYDHLKQEQENLEERHQRFIIEYGHEGSETRKDKETILALEREKESLEKTVALINGQMLLVEGGKKRLDDVVDDLQTEIVSLRQQLEEAEKKIEEFSKKEKAVTNGHTLGFRAEETQAEGPSNLPVFPSMRARHQPEVDALQEEINILNEQLDESKYEQDKQRRLVQSMKDDLDEERSKKPTQIRSQSFRDLPLESLDDVGTELRDMRGELHKLMGVIESKDHAIETLENQLRTSKEEIKMKSQAMNDLQSLVSNLEGKNNDLRTSTDSLRHSLEEKLSPRVASPRLASPRLTSPSPSRRTPSPTLKGSRIPTRKIDEPADSEQIKRSHSDKGGDRLQNLISKYRGYNDGGSSQPERKIKPLSLTSSNKMGLVTKGRSFGPAAAKSSDKEVSGGSPSTECFVKSRVQESHNLPTSSRTSADATADIKSSPQESSSSNLVKEAESASHIGSMSMPRVTLGTTSSQDNSLISQECSSPTLQAKPANDQNEHSKQHDSVANGDLDFAAEMRNAGVAVETVDAGYQAGGGQTEDHATSPTFNPAGSMLSKQLHAVAVGSSIGEGLDGEVGLAEYQGADAEGADDNDEDDEDEEETDSDENNSDHEQRDIDALIDSCYRTHLAFLKKLKKRGSRPPKGGTRKLLGCKDTSKNLSATT